MEQQAEQNTAAVTAEEEQQESRSVFRSKSIDRISSPEQLNEYIRVATPRMWVLLIAVAVFLTGAIIWAMSGTVESAVFGVAIVKDGSCTVYVSSDSAKAMEAGHAVYLDNADTMLISVSPEPVRITADFPEYAREIGDFVIGEWALSGEAEAVSLPSGIYSALVVEETITPFSLLSDKDE